MILGINHFTIRVPDPMASMTFFLMGATERLGVKVKTRMSRAGNNHAVSWVGRSIPTVQIGGIAADDKSDDGKTILSTK